MRDNFNNTKSVLILAPLDLNTDRKSEALDTQGADAVKLVVTTGDGVTYTGTNKVSWRLQHSDTTTDGDFAAVVQADVIGVELGANGQLVEFVTAIADGRTTTVGYKGAKRFVRVISVKGGTVTGGIGSVVGELAELHQAPAGFAVAS
jgi:hypothetical protein